MGGNVFASLVPHRVLISIPGPLVSCKTICDLTEATAFRFGSRSHTERVWGAALGLVRVKPTCARLWAIAAEQPFSVKIQNSACDFYLECPPVTSVGLRADCASACIFSRVGQRRLSSQERRQGHNDDQSQMDYHAMMMYSTSTHYVWVGMARVNYFRSSLFIIRNRLGYRTRRMRRLLGTAACTHRGSLQRLGRWIRAEAGRPCRRRPRKD